MKERLICVLMLKIIITFSYYVIFPVICPILRYLILYTKISIMNWEYHILELKDECWLKG